MVRLIPAVCPQCGAKLQLPDDLKKGYCTYCGTQIIIDKEASVESLKVCEHCGSGIEAMKLADFIKTALS